MADQQLVDAADSVKIGSGIGAGGLLMFMLQRLFGGQDKVLARLDKLGDDVAELKTSVAVMCASSERRDAELLALREDTQRNATSHANLRAVVAGLQGKK